MSKLYIIRTSKGMTQTKLAELSGINARQIRKIESGEIKTRNITVGTITALAHALHFITSFWAEKAVNAIVHGL